MSSGLIGRRLCCLECGLKGERARPRWQMKVGMEKCDGSEETERSLPRSDRSTNTRDFPRSDQSTNEHDCFFLESTFIYRTYVTSPLCINHFSSAATNGPDMHSGVRQYSVLSTAEADEPCQAPSLAPSCSPSSRCRGACNLTASTTRGRSNDPDAAAQRHSACGLDRPPLPSGHSSSACRVRPQFTPTQDEACTVRPLGHERRWWKRRRDNRNDVVTTTIATVVTTTTTTTTAR